MESNKEESIIRTLTYFDIFDYPLTLSEIKKFNEEVLPATDNELMDNINEISIIQEHKGYYYLLGRREIVEKRIERNEISIFKLAKAFLVSKILSKIPTVKLVGISGSLSMSNCKESDDIDLFIITRKNTMWITRFLVSFVLLVAKQKRTPKSKTSADLICPNMFVSESSMALPVSLRNLYTAHEIVQMKVLYEKNDTYKKFLVKNRWVSRFLPNVSGFNRIIRVYRTGRIINLILSPIDRVFYYLQLLYMMPKKTVEKTSKGLAMFHPVNKAGIILDLYTVKTKLNIEYYKQTSFIDKEDAKFYFEEKKIRILN